MDQSRSPTLSAVGGFAGYEILEDRATETVRISWICDDTGGELGVHMGGLFSPDARPGSARDVGAAGREVAGDSV
ncbi:hypothetical protein [Streptomyces sp. NPDC002133]|uniref:hypothetical protein n=1 Tax=Streptomyces sp. NPDC002133 TaxID=3154409 RepID=UPI0033199113